MSGTSFTVGHKQDCARFFGGYACTCGVEPPASDAPAGPCCASSNPYGHAADCPNNPWRADRPADEAEIRKLLEHYGVHKKHCYLCESIPGIRAYVATQVEAATRERDHQWWQALAPIDTIVQEPEAVKGFLCSLQDDLLKEAVAAATERAEKAERSALRWEQLGDERNNERILELTAQVDELERQLAAAQERIKELEHATTEAIKTAARIIREEMKP